MLRNLIPRTSPPGRPAVLLCAVASAAVMLTGSGVLALGGPGDGLTGASPPPEAAGAGSPPAGGPVAGPVTPAPPQPAVTPSTPPSTPVTPPRGVTWPPNRSGTGGPDPDEGQPPVVRVPESAAGRYRRAGGTDLPPAGARGPVVRYMVEVEKGLPFDPEEFAAAVHRTLNDPRSWGAGGRMRFKRVDHGRVRFRVALSSPAMTNRQCLPMQTFGELSCWNGRRSVINAKRWGQAVPGYRGDLAAYREYVVNHEVGHALGHGHVSCPGPGRRAPVMTQQTKSLQGCRPNAWPFPGHRKR
ncbi:hypothetical protein Sru01_61740 [Sphaerisporangium rufum]|uniref:DUF3152 domain-containing protein n=1 Tax=Sphaerisporangium rufum TaxID=1381558 RepID=A0A919V3T9_9ACTN|nr:DUF3152 domain-containing protein [Sphaerisporangium rufum]GII81192.1 hypothetical protein Sru01_61740 [Sphaerisporangium rufum]